ncbi:hypothetical protein SPSIL_056140 [Sporomusa silvacetica DSM 10669]|uniref:Chloroplast import component protein (Tic20) n=1 Tax=Sporomusa silvacetica DSM 10669 TaxID=1123289 RepID=A0ABZ3IUV2_9FIRM|nr:hypothetical protein [Sporomusa silvacetica]OZC13002.1 hypothetical protein SPSIL_57210 [Sporomusa silvacetica DSM 10669]
MDWKKATGYFGLLCIIIAVLAQVIATIAPNFLGIEPCDAIIRWAIYLWVYAIIVTGIYLEQITGHFFELLLGLFAGILCLVFWLTIPVALIYFFRAFAKISKTNGGLPF